MASPKTLREWCRVTCAGYPDVEIKDMSSSFRDGLAFCAIIHKHRPHLIDFSSLSKDNVYENNKLAYEVAETKLGIPALLDPKDMILTKVPDCLGVISYISQYYYFFNGKSYGPYRSWSSHVVVLNNLPKGDSTEDQTHLKSLTDLESSTADSFANSRTRTVCSLCFKPVHFIQRRLIDGKAYHRSCFRCKVCHCSLLAGSYTQGSDTRSLICAYHVTEAATASSDINKLIRSTNNRSEREVPVDFHSLDGVAVTSVPCYTQTAESRDRPVGKTDWVGKQGGSKEVKDGENSGPCCRPPSGIKGATVQEVKNKGGVTSEAVIRSGDEARISELSSPREGGTGPVPAPRRSSAVPVPAPRARSARTMSAAGIADSQSESQLASPHVTSPKVQTNHPWLNIVHPGPWTQLPPAPAPVPFPRSKTVSNTRAAGSGPRAPPPNPFEEEGVEEALREEAKLKSADQNKPSGADVHSKSGDTRSVLGANNPPVESVQSTGKLPDKPRRSHLAKGGGDAAPETAKAATAGPVEALGELRVVSSDVTDTQGPIFPRSLSVPAITAEPPQSDPAPAELREADEPLTPRQSKTACKENPFNRKLEMSKSKTFQDLSSSRGTAPGHGFPLIKRKVKAEQDVPVEDLQVQMKELDTKLKALEQRGIELERSLTGCKKGKEEEQMLTEWFSLIHERHILSRKDTELVYLSKQQKLEDRQADVEYELRCLLNKPESDWSQKDRGREQQLMDELVAIIEQRNQIISSLDQDRQREKEQDILWEGRMGDKDVKKEVPKELRSSRGKFKPAKVFKMLNIKAGSSKASVEKKS
ncbi:MICAL-like protein 1 [Menidia menidia]